MILTIDSLKPYVFDFFVNVIFTRFHLLLQNTAISKHLENPRSILEQPVELFFSADVWISGGQVIFHYKFGAYL